MLRSLWFCLLGGGLLLAGPVCAAETAEPHAPLFANLTNQTELSYVRTRGNSEVTTFSIKNKLGYQFSERFSGLWKFEALNGDSEGVRNAESYFTELRGDYQLGPRRFTYGSLSWFKDRFADIDLRLISGVGYGYRLIDSPPHLLVTEAGLTHTLEQTPDDDSSEIGARFYARYEYRISDDSLFSQDFEYLAELTDLNSHRVNTETALTTAINSFLALKTSYVMRYDSDPPRRKEDTDTILGVSLVVKF
ncbi:MAG: DUF481 domain-containing protein [Desulfuromonas thiophila]|jgi:putative salt-induced outer membrane protein|nr:DUF481 domain-containing protein [Desulfuromonas thiophila]